MRTTRTPLRITLGGGGSDLERGGICIAATIDRYVTITVADEWTGDYVLHYSESERCQEAHQIKHRIFRDTFERHGVKPCQVSSVADVPAGTGLGNSGAFTVGLLHALHPEWSKPRLAREACALDIGQQDQWSAVYGGCNVYDFTLGTVRPIETNAGQWLALYDTGLRHNAAEILTGPGKPDHVAREQVEQMSEALADDDLIAVGAELHDQWMTKLCASPTTAHRMIHERITAGIMAGAVGGKLVGAGDGGFILFATDDHPRLDATMRSYGLERLPFTLTADGTRCV